MIKLIAWFVGILFLLYVLLCLFFYFFQERFLFFPQKLPSGIRFSYPFNFEEYFIEVEEGIKLNGLLFKAENVNHKTEAKGSRGESKGLVFYLHGNAGALNNWGYAAEDFLQQGYDVFILDYRGYGKSDGTISSQKQLFNDVEKVYLEVEKLYEESRIIITGFSIGSGPASWLASRHSVKMLILIAPFFNLSELANHYFPFLPSFILRYPLQNNKYLQKVEEPVVLIHGRKDEIIPYESSQKLKKVLKPEDKLFILEGLGHNNISGNNPFKQVLDEVLF